MIAIYYRVSTDKQELDMQKHAIREWYDKHGNNAKYRTFSDKGMSGSDDNRPAFKEMLSGCKRGDFNTVVCYRLDRFSRSSSTAIRKIIELGDMDIAFVAVDQPQLSLGQDSPIRHVMLAVFAMLADLERQAIVARVKVGLAAAVARGVKLGRPSIITVETRTKVRELRAERLSMREVAKAVGISPASVVKIMKEEVA